MYLDKTIAPRKEAKKRLSKRRYALPEQEAEIARLALRITLSNLQEIENTPHSTPYDIWLKARAEDLLKKLENYQWEV